MKFRAHHLHINTKHDKGIVIDKISHNNPYDHSQIHRHNYHEILFFFNGNGGEQKIDFVDYKIKKQAIYIIASGQIHLLKKKPEENGISIQFSEEFLSVNFASLQWEWMELFQNHSELVLNDSTFNELSGLSQKLLAAFENKTAMSFQKIVNYIGLILIELFEFANKEQQSDVPNQHSIALQFASLVQKHFRDKRNVKDYASILNISTNKLTIKVGDCFGKTPKEFIQNTLLLEVKRLLVVNELSHKEISHQLNFDSQNSYNRFITNHTGQTPSELKKALIEIHK